MNQELELQNPEKDNPWFMALATFISFAGFGLIPLMPYILAQGNGNLFTYSVLSTVVALILLGTLRWRVSKQGLTRSISETLILGGIAALVAYFVGTLFRV